MRKGKLTSSAGALILGDEDIATKYKAEYRSTDRRMRREDDEARFF